MNDNDFKTMCNPISGRDLIDIYPEYEKIVFPDFVSQTPGIAIEKIKQYFKVQPSINGNNIPGILDIRDRLFKLVEQKEFVNAFAIVASHTHWRAQKPIVYNYFINENQYIIGPHSINSDSIYYPVSFVFHEDFPLAFEWAEGLPLNIKEFEIALLIINKLNSEIQNKKYPIGISIDFRFKKSLFENPIFSVEVPIDEIGQKYLGFSKINTLEYFESNKQDEETEQVAWHPFSDLNLSLEEGELQVLKNLREYIVYDTQPLEKINELTKLMREKD